MWGLCAQWSARRQRQKSRHELDGNLCIAIPLDGAPCEIRTSVGTTPGRSDRHAIGSIAVSRFVRPSLPITRPLRQNRCHANAGRLLLERRKDFAFGLWTLLRDPSYEVRLC